VAFAAGALGAALAIGRFLPWAQPHVERAAAELAEPPVTSYSGLSFSSRLGDIQELKLSRRVVMRVWTTRPQKLRARVFTRFDGQVWHALGGPEREIAAGALPADTDLAAWLDVIPGRSFRDARENVVLPPTAVRTLIVQRVFNEGALVSPPRPLFVRAAVTSLRLDAGGVLVPPRGSEAEIFGLVNAPSPVDVRPAGAPDPETLAVPADTDARLRDVAAALAAEAPSPELRVLATLAFLERECRYTLTVGAFHTRQPVAEFVLEKKRGYCEYFASAAALLLRLEGVPARYVKGFEVKDGSRSGDHYVVREADAHAWVDVYLPGQGWVEADPTPAAEYDQLHAGVGRGALDGVLEWFVASFAELRARLGLGDFKGFFDALGRPLRIAVERVFVRPWPLWAVVVALLASLRAWRRRAVHRRTLRRGWTTAEPAPTELRALLARLDRALERRGHRRAPSRAPLEHLESLERLRGQPPSKLPPELIAAGRQVVDCYYRARFGGKSVAAAEIETVDAALRQAAGD
jgi:hypothetical protein